MPSRLAFHSNTEPKINTYIFIKQNPK